MKNNKLDQFYTNPKIVDSLLKIVFDLFYSLRNDQSQYTFIEPSAGSGNFIDGLYKLGVDIKKNVRAFDIDPKNNSIIEKKDFFDVNFNEMNLNKKKTVTIGNPPFGKKGDLALKFLNKSLEHSGIVAFILPKIFNRYLTQSKVKNDSKLIFQQNIDSNSFLVNDREYNVNCCFQIWISPEVKVSISNLRLEKQIKALTSDVELFVHNNTKETLKYFDKKKYNWDFAVHRQGYYDYNKKIINPKKLIQNRQYLFIKCKNEEIKQYVEKIDFSKLSKENSTTIFGFSNSDFYKELYELILHEFSEKEFNFD
ncbi:type II DNA methylase [[Mycoplasma] mobile]|uniref:Putative type II DNA methylase protein n=1 Tax=Mycoplasma mobile (strain ATCC 43663 / 163K / NCTC 11711) TaxID=267748 RepID=Q6KIJ5_MYCM1|nr:type II DNA methylase [[Mycoplasma] mobile]AAT27581.1 putative type II DNA methylase protein [Mycoplasma mobile 163K]